MHMHGNKTHREKRKKK
uniref:Yeast NUC1 mitochondrial nuclease n=1 Tax=Saccharomyces cerevisiae TaxID=4932 RepID=A2NUH8_YEASX|nr:unnamed protein product [Saccharomyces cerevisiae]